MLCVANPSQFTSRGQTGILATMSNEGVGYHPAGSVELKRSGSFQDKDLGDESDRIISDSLEIPVPRSMTQIVKGVMIRRPKMPSSCRLCNLPKRSEQSNLQAAAGWIREGISHRACKPDYDKKWTEKASC